MPVTPFRPVYLSAMRPVRRADTSSGCNVHHGKITWRNKGCHPTLFSMILPRRRYFRQREASGSLSVSKFSNAS